MSGDTVVTLVADLTEKANPNNQTYLDRILDLRTEFNDSADPPDDRRRGVI